MNRRTRNSKRMRALASPVEEQEEAVIPEHEDAIDAVDAEDGDEKENKQVRYVPVQFPAQTLGSSSAFSSNSAISSSIATSFSSDLVNMNMPPMPGLHQPLDPDLCFKIAGQAAEEAWESKDPELEQTKPKSLEKRRILKKGTFGSGGDDRMTNAFNDIEKDPNLSLKQAILDNFDFPKVPNGTRQDAHIDKDGYSLQLRINALRGRRRHAAKKKAEQAIVDQLLREEEESKEVEEVEEETLPAGSVNELKETREELKATREELKATREELKATRELLEETREVLVETRQVLDKIANATMTK